MEKVLLTSATYVAFIASKAKASKILDLLKERGVAAARLSHVRAPAGLDIRAASPEEIAVSILAEIIQVNGTRAPAPKANEDSLAMNQEAKDPICGMTVAVSAAKYKSEFHGNSFYFCCSGCKQTFDKQPDKYVLASAA
jgi:xanthine dehydrogenase accessory factor